MLMENNLDFKFEWNVPNSIGTLSCEDLHFFYYDIAAESLTKYSVCNDWDEDIKSFITSHNLTIDTMWRSRVTI